MNEHSPMPCFPISLWPGMLLVAPKIGGCGCWSGFGQHPTLRAHLPVLAVGLVLVFGPRAHDVAERLAPHLPRLVGLDVETLEFRTGRGAAGAEVDAAVGDEVEHRDRLRGADRVVVRLRQQAHAVSDADVVRERGDRAVEHLGVRTVRVLLEEVVLHGPERVEPHLVAEHGLLDRVLVRLVLLVRRPRSGDGDLVEQRELHRLVRLSEGW